LLAAIFFWTTWTMRQLLIIILTLITVDTFSQEFEVITSDKSQVKVKIIDDSKKQQLLTEFEGVQDNDLRKRLTARTFRLSDNRLIVEFYDKQAIIVDNLADFKRLEKVTFVKNIVWNLKKNISYKIDLPFDTGTEIVKTEKPKQLTQFKSDLPQYWNFEVYQLPTNQILFIYQSESEKLATLYRDLKTLASENSSISEQHYSYDDEYLMQQLAKGDSLSDYEPNEHLVYPKYVKQIIKNHKLKLIEQKVFVNDFYGNLYSSENGYHVLIDEENQKNGAGDKMPILTLRIYSTLDEVRDAQKRYEQFKLDFKPGQSEHFYQQLSNKYGDQFPQHVASLIDSLPIVLNFDKEQLTMDEGGIEISDEALKWNGTNFSLFESWFPSALAYYGQFFITNKNEGKWTVKFDSENKVWIPEVLLNDNTSAFDSNDFYKSMYEGPIPMKWAGDFDQSRKKWKSEK
jgi:hypothetical protein